LLHYCCGLHLDIDGCNKIVSEPPGYLFTNVFLPIAMMFLEAMESVVPDEYQTQIARSQVTQNYLQTISSTKKTDLPRILVEEIFSEERIPTIAKSTEKSEKLLKIQIPNLVVRSKKIN
jgi:hypothetical protein